SRCAGPVDPRSPWPGRKVTAQGPCLSEGAPRCDLGARGLRSIHASLPRWRRPLLGALAIATAAALAMVPKLRAVFAPEELVPARAEDAARLEALLGPFGHGDAPLLVLIRAP